MYLYTITQSCYMFHIFPMAIEYSGVGHQQALLYGKLMMKEGANNMVKEFSI